MVAPLFAQHRPTVEDKRKRKEDGDRHDEIAWERKNLNNRKDATEEGSKKHGREKKSLIAEKRTLRKNPAAAEPLSKRGIFSPTQKSGRKRN